MLFFTMENGWQGLIGSLFTMEHKLEGLLGSIFNMNGDDLFGMAFLFFTFTRMNSEVTA